MDMVLKFLPLIAALASATVVIGTLLGWLLKKSYDIAKLVGGIEESLKSHTLLHEHHTGNHKAHDERIREVEQTVARHSGQWSKV